MTLTGSYVDAAEAETYFENNPRAITFLDSEYLEWYLQEATRHIDYLPLKGCKYADDASQPRAFPRIPDAAAQTAGTDETNFQSETDYSTVPQEVLDACCEEALAMFRQDAAGGQDRQLLRDMGVKSYTIGGKLQETFTDAAPQKLVSPRAREALRYWIAKLVEAA